MIWCLRISPLIAATVLALRARWLIGLFTGAGAGSATAPSSTFDAWSALNMLRGGGTVVSQFFAWLYVVLGICVVWGLAAFIVGEIKLRREFRQGRSAPPPEFRPYLPGYRPGFEQPPSGPDPRAGRPLPGPQSLQRPVGYRPPPPPGFPPRGDRPWDSAEQSRYMDGW